MDDSVKYIDGMQAMVIVNHGMDSKVLKIIKSHGVWGGVVLLGTGTIKNKLLEFFELTDIRKEIIIFSGPKDICKAALEDLYKTLHMEKPNHGIAFCTELSGVVNSRGIYKSSNESNKLQSEEPSMYTKILTTVDKGKAESVMDAAVSAGARGGTIINARGSGINQTSVVFSMEIEPEKELVLILVKDEIVDAVVTAISEKQKINEPGNGIIFTQKVLNIYGLTEA